MKKATRQRTVGQRERVRSAYVRPCTGGGAIGKSGDSVKDRSLTHVYLHVQLCFVAGLPLLSACSRGMGSLFPPTQSFHDLKLVIGGIATSRSIFGLFSFFCSPKARNTSVSREDQEDLGRVDREDRVGLHLRGQTIITCMSAGRQDGSG